MILGVSLPIKGEFLKTMYFKVNLKSWFQGAKIMNAYVVDDSKYKCIYVGTE